MKRIIALLLISVCMPAMFSGVAFAESAPDAMSYFTNDSYNKTYIGEDGLEHHISVKWIGETWNKIGTVIYSINYEDVYPKDNSTYIDVKSATQIYENACPTYPDCPEYSVYQVKWYPDGSKEVISDYRTPATPVPTTQPAVAPTFKTATKWIVTAVLLLVIAVSALLLKKKRAKGER